jgi:hypothetical protein
VGERRCEAAVGELGRRDEQLACEPSPSYVVTVVGATVVVVAGVTGGALGLVPMPGVTSWPDAVRTSNGAAAPDMLPCGVVELTCIVHVPGTPNGR